jgi:hypothetical protein
VPVRAGPSPEAPIVGRLPPAVAYEGGLYSGRGPEYPPIVHVLEPACAESDIAPIVRSRIAARDRVIARPSPEAPIVGRLPPAVAYEGGLYSGRGPEFAIVEAPRPPP